MGLGKRLLLLAASWIVFNFVLWLIPKIAPTVPERYEGVPAVAVPPVASDTAVATTPPTLPSGFPSMERPPPKIEVPDGQPQPIATKFGLTYDVPADWRNSSTGVVRWTTGDKSVTYGAIGDYGYGHCPETDGSTLADTGMTGRNGVDIHTAALEAARGAEIIFGDSQGASTPALTYSPPIEFSIDDKPAVRYTVRADNIHRRHDCDPTQAIFDVVATAGYATAAVAVFMVELDQNIEGALDHSLADSIISTIRPSDHTPGE